MAGAFNRGEAVMKAQTYTRRFSAPIAVLPAALLSCALVVPMSAQNPGANPVSHVAYIPAGSDLTTIRFEKARLVKTESSTTAYEVIYCFVGQPATSDESKDEHSTFSAYFRPEELSPKVRKALSESSLSGSDAARYFTVNTSRETVRKSVIDTAQSTFCPAFNYVGGKGTQTNTGCQDEIRYKWVRVPSPYITVSVDPVSGVAPRPADALIGKP
jgi:hypothetical protein